MKRCLFISGIFVFLQFSRSLFPFYYVSFNIRLSLFVLVPVNICLFVYVCRSGKFYKVVVVEKDVQLLCWCEQINVLHLFPARLSGIWLRRNTVFIDKITTYESNHMDIRHCNATKEEKKKKKSYWKSFDLFVNPNELINEKEMIFDGTMFQFQFQRICHRWFHFMTYKIKLIHNETNLIG